MEIFNKFLLKTQVFVPIQANFRVLNQVVHARI